MYIFQRIYKDCESVSVDSDKRKLAVILPSAPQAEMMRFAQIISQCVCKVNTQTVGRKWQVAVLSSKDAARTPSHNYDAVYHADLVIAECTDKKPNVSIWWAWRTRSGGRCVRVTDRSETEK